MAGKRKGPRFVPERVTGSGTYRPPGSELGRWWGILEGRTPGWIGQCQGYCRKLYVLEQGEAEDGLLIGWHCQSVVTQRRDLCGGRVRELPGQAGLISAFLLGGVLAVANMMEPIDGDAAGKYLEGYVPRKP